MSDTTGNGEIHRDAALLMYSAGDDLLAESVEEISLTHTASEELAQCTECGASWPCYAWTSSNDRVIRWLTQKAAKG